MRWLTTFLHKLARDRELMTLVIILAALFYLQVRFLHLAAFTISDEAVHALAGRYLWQGVLPYSGFAYGHPPLLPALLGWSQQFSPLLVWPRSVYLFLNLTAAIPLFLFLRRLNGNAAAALVAVLFYVTYHQMVNHNFRFIALRQVANVLLIWLLYAGIVAAHSRRAFAAQMALAVAGTLLLFQGVANMALAAIALFFVRPRAQWKLRLKRLILIGTAIGITLVLFFLCVPESFQYTLLDHSTRPLVDRWGRIAWTRGWGTHDLYFYGAGLTGLLFGTFFSPRLRALCIASLGMIGLVFLPRAFFPHYFDIAGPALAIGVFALISLVLHLFRGRFLFIGHTIAILLLAIHWTIVLPPLMAEWRGNRNPEYHAFIATLSRSPEPLLTFFEPVYAVESGRTMVYDKRLPDFRTYGSLLGQHLTDAEYHSLAARACSILLVPWDTGYVPQHIQSLWLQQFERVPTAELYILLQTHHDHCRK